MKGLFPTFRKSFMLVVALMFSAMLWSEKASAQDIVEANLMTPTEAIGILNQEIGVMDTQLQVSYSESLDYKRKFYSGIVISLEQGQPVLTSVNENIAKFKPGSTDVGLVEIPNPLSASVWQNYYDEVLQILQN